MCGPVLLLRCVALSKHDLPLKKMLYLYLRTAAKQNAAVALLVVQVRQQHMGAPAIHHCSLQTVPRWASRTRQAVCRGCSLHARPAAPFTSPILAAPACRRC